MKWATVLKKLTPSERTHMRKMNVLSKTRFAWEWESMNSGLRDSVCSDCEHILVKLTKWGVL